MKATDPEQIKVGTVDAALNLAVPEIDLLFRLLENDGAAFNRLLSKPSSSIKSTGAKKSLKMILAVSWHLALWDLLLSLMSEASI
jgi:hypothetical protein